MKRAVIVTKHLFGFGGGADTIFSFAEALKALDYDTVVYSRTDVPAPLASTLGALGVGLASHYRGCAAHADLLLNIDHHYYEAPLAKLNLLHVFHPHELNKPPETGYQRMSTNSKYSAFWCQREWGLNFDVLYPPISRAFTEGRKENLILHVSRFTPPTTYADKGQEQMIRAFQWLCDSGVSGYSFALAGSLEDPIYLKRLQTLASGYPIAFYPNIAQGELENLYGRSAFYWHATGVSMPEVHNAQEHLGLTTLEAMASGAVPIVLGTGGQPEIVAHHRDGFLCSSTHEMAEYTQYLIGNLAEWSLMARNAKAAARPWQDMPAFTARVEAWIKGEDYTLMDDAVAPEVSYAAEDVCAIIPVCGGVEYTASLLKSLYRTQSNIGQVIVVDNGSTDATAEVVGGMLRDQDGLVIFPQNLGFAKAMAFMKERTDKPLLLALNNDMVCLDEGWLYPMLEAMQPDVGVVGAKLLFPNGLLQHAGGVLDFNRHEVGFHRWYGQPDHPGANQMEPVAFVTGACALVRKELWNWAYDWPGLNYEDVDLCLAAKEKGYITMYQPGARLIHYDGITKRAMPESPALVQSNRTAFIEKWYERLTHVYPFMMTLNNALLKDCTA